MSFDTHTHTHTMDICGSHTSVVTESLFALISSKNWTQVKLLWQDRCSFEAISLFPF